MNNQTHCTCNHISSDRCISLGETSRVSSHLQTVVHIYVSFLLTCTRTLKRHVAVVHMLSQREFNITLGYRHNIQTGTCCFSTVQRHDKCTLWQSYTSCSFRSKPYTPLQKTSLTLVLKSVLTSKNLVLVRLFFLVFFGMI